MGIFDFFQQQALKNSSFNNNDDSDASFEATPRRGNLKLQLSVLLKKYGFTKLEIKEVLDVIALAEADIRVAEDSLAHVNINNPDPTRSMHAALEQIKSYKDEVAYDVRKKIMEIIARKKQVKKAKQAKKK